MLYTERTTCRLCDGTLKDVISLGDIHLSTFLDTNDNPPPKIPLDLVQCTQCNLIQLRHTTSGSAMYSDYWYQSGLNGSMVRALNNVVEEVFKRVFLNTHDIVVDIGSNDGTLLNFYPQYLTRVGFEPSNLAVSSFAKADIVINDYFNKDAFIQRFGDRKAKVITAIAMFYDLEEPHRFVQDLHDILADDGIIVIQMMDLLSMMKYGDFPNICHEHLEYYSLEVFKKLFEEHGLEIFDVEYNGVNGGSMRTYIRKDTTRVNNGVEILPTVDNAKMRVFMVIERERQFFNDAGDIGIYFNTKIEDTRTKIVQFINRTNRAGQTVAVMGASTKGNTILQYFDLTDADIIHAAEINPDKFGKRTVGSNIPIISQKESMKHHVDYYLILPWGFIDNFIDRNRSYLMNGGQFIVPLPEPRVIGMDAEGKVWTVNL
jgi:NDP-4-keto-2,6-dideoxyhexose 3-C-methyltransferase